MSIVREFSKMLSSIPHEQSFTQLLIDQIVTYYDKCCGWYKGKLIWIVIQQVLWPRTDLRA